MDVSGLTPTEIEDLLRDRLKAAYIRDPQVKVNMIETTRRS